MVRSLKPPLLIVWLVPEFQIRVVSFLLSVIPVIHNLKRELEDLGCHVQEELAERLTGG